MTTVGKKPVSYAQLEEVRSGVDIVELAKFARGLEMGGDRFLQRVYLRDELEYCRGRVGNLAARFAAKEAVSKALGTGIRGLLWREIEVTRAACGAPGVALHGRAAAVAARQGLRAWTVSLSHTENFAVALVQALKVKNAERLCEGAR